MPRITDKIMDDVFAKIMKDIENNILYGANYNPCTSANAEIPKGIFGLDPEQATYVEDMDIIVLNESEYTIKDEEEQNGK